MTNDQKHSIAPTASQKPPNKVKLGISIPPDLKDLIVAVANEKKVSISDMCSHYIAHGLKHEGWGIRERNTLPMDG